MIAIFRTSSLATVGLAKDSNRRQRAPILAERAGYNIIAEHHERGRRHTCLHTALGMAGTIRTDSALHQC